MLSLLLIVTKFTTMNPQNEDADKDGDILLRHVMVLISNISYLESADFTTILRLRAGGRRDVKLRYRLRLRLRF